MKKRVAIAVSALTIMSVNVSAASSFSISSRDIPGGHQLTQHQVFEGFGCHGGNESPQLEWKNPPSGTKSFAITVFDPDAPTGSGWWHWTVVNIPVQTLNLPAGAGNQNNEKLPAGAVQGRNDFGYSGFGGHVHLKETNLTVTSLPSGPWMRINSLSIKMPVVHWSALCLTATPWKKHN